MTTAAMIVGLIAGVIGLVTNAPQAIKVWRSGSDQGVNVVMWILTFSTFSVWLGYGLRTGNVPVILANVGVLLVVGCVLIAISRARRRDVRADVGLLAMFAVGVALASFLLPVPIVVGYFVAASVVPWMQAVTSWRTLRHGTPSNVSRLTLSIRLVGMSLWMAHGLLISDLAIILSIGASFMGTAVTLVLETVAGRRRHATPRPTTSI